ncbi:asparagine synthase (glutamine-hydrolyzing) [Thalassospiraceae bacterium LMO-JJ14]|nr:asparagine synthase (glutamine-hydrolyzing) [Thalassospiraceae bacterium LMO-JJ14]
MCGIAGAFGPQPTDAQRIHGALASMRHRGPDAEAAANYTLGENHISLLHTRLAIIDLDPRANQPFERDGIALTYNGEIYNYVELRDELTSLGHSFSTASDTEVLIEAYREWGPAFLDRLDGMWAFALFDRTTSELILSRDRFGEKPLYTWFVGDTLYFASEIKTLTALVGRKPPVNTEQLRRYLVNGYKCLGKSGQTYFEGVSALPSGSCAIMQTPARPAPAPYWRLAMDTRETSFEDAVAHAKSLLIRAVETRMRADVPLAFCLSGGVDSATLAAIAAKNMGHDIHCFSIIDSDERYDESANIDIMVRHLDCRHHRVQTSTEGFFERLRAQVAAHDAPVVTISYYMHAFLSEAIAENGYKIAISGTAADEIFTGYYDHYSMWLAAMHDTPGVDFEALVGAWKSGMGAFVQNPGLQDPLCFVKNPDQRDHITLDRALFSSFLTEPFSESWSEDNYTDALLRNRMANELFTEAVPVILNEDDLNSMMFSIENRSPFLDRALVEYLYSVPARHLMGGGYAKRILREIGAGIVPDQVRLDTRKRGFNASINSLVDRNDPETREILLSESPIFDIVKRSAIEEFLNGDMASNSFSKFLFSFISSKLFLETQAQ